MTPPPLVTPPARPTAPAPHGSRAAAMHGAHIGRAKPWRPVLPVLPAGTAAPSNEAGPAVEPGSASDAPRRVPFYPRHWRLLTMAALGLALYAGLLYVPAAFDAMQAQKAEEGRLAALLQDEGDLERRWSRVRALQAMPPPSETASLARIQEVAGAWSLDVIDMRPVPEGATASEEADTTAALWRVQARGRFHSVVGFAAALETGDEALVLRRLRVASPDSAGSSLKVEADVLVPSSQTP